MVGGYLPKMVVEPVYIQKSISSLFYLSFQGAVSVESMSAGFSEMSGHGKPLKPGNLTETALRELRFGWEVVEKEPVEIVSFQW